MPIIHNNGAELYYEEHCYSDNGMPLVLAHGMGGNHAIWFKQLPVLAKYFRVITFDHRGFGNSTDLQGLGRSAYVEDLKAILDHLDIKRAILVGQSMGGGTCIGFTCSFPERVAYLVAADTLHCLEESEPVREIMDAARAATNDLSLIDRVLGRRVRKQDPSAAILYSKINSFNQVTRHSLRGALPKFSPQQLAATGVPVLFIAGVEDVLFPVEAIRLVHQQVVGSQLVELEDTGHSAFYESPDEFNAALLEVLQ